MTWYVFPFAGNKRVDVITTGDMERVLKPIWVEKRAVGRTVAQRCIKVFEAAVYRDYRTDNLASNACAEGARRSGA